MNISTLLYAIVVGTLFSLAALSSERSLRGSGRATRSVWLVAVALISVWPVAMMLVGSPPTSAAISPPAHLEATSPATASARAASPGAIAAPTITFPSLAPRSVRLDRIAFGIAIVTPALMLAVLLVDLVRITRARRRWRATTVDGVPVLLSDEFGPAIVGVRDPQIVLPVWVLALPLAQQRLLLAHESEHLARHDSKALLVGALAVACAPWNPAAWWSFGRLRLALEVDCDQRVLQRGHDLRAYGELLLAIGRRAARSGMLATAFAERRSVLRTRITLITAIPTGTLSSRIAGGIFAAVTVLTACAIRPAATTGATPYAGTPRPIGHVPSPLAGDSIAMPAADSSNTVYRLTGAATGLPRKFSVTVPGPQNDPRLPSCPLQLSDPATGATLRIRGAVSHWVARTDAKGTSTELQAAAYYYVRPAGTYGVSANMVLRVGCGTPSATANSTGAPQSGTTADISGTLRGNYLIVADSIKWSPTRLDLGFLADSVQWPEARVRSLAGTLARLRPGVDTITITLMLAPMRPTYWQSQTWFFYPKLMPETLH